MGKHAEWARKRRAAYHDKALEASRKAYETRKAREAADPELRARRLEKARQWAEANRDKLALASMRHYDKVRSTPALLEKARWQQRLTWWRYRDNPVNRRKVLARWRSSRALRDGRLERRPCETCGDPKSQMHHDDYGRALDVRWLCKAHHEAAHHG